MMAIIEKIRYLIIQNSVIIFIENDISCDFRNA